MMMYSSKKAVGVSQVFIFILAGITFALIMIFGYRAVADFIEKGEQVKFVQFVTQLEGSIKQIYSEYGAVREKRYTLPGKFTQICFVDMNSAAVDRDLLCSFDAIACELWEESQKLDEQGKPKGFNGVDANVFLQPVAPNAIKVYQISVVSETEGFLCLPIRNGQFKLTIEGKGDHTELSKPAAES